MRNIPIIGQPGIGAMEIKRPPKAHRCSRCGAESILILPQWPGRITWKCSCGQDHVQEFGSAVEAVIEQMVSLKLARPPVLHECDACGVQDYLVVPGSGGELRWTCKCGTVWAFRWMPNGNGETMWMRGKVMGSRTIKVPVQNLCGCGKPECPHCGG